MEERRIANLSATNEELSATIKDLSAILAHALEEKRKADEKIAATEEVVERQRNRIRHLETALDVYAAAARKLLALIGKR